MGVVNASLKLIVPLVLVKVTPVVVSTAPANVAPPEFVTVKRPMFVPMVLSKLKAPVVLITTFAGQFKFSPNGAAIGIPAIEPTVIEPDPPPPKVNVTPLASTMLSKTIGITPKSIVVLAPINSVVPAVKLIPQSLPVHVRIVDFVKVPATLFEPACLIPRSNVRTSGVPVVKHTQSMIVVAKSP